MDTLKKSLSIGFLSSDFNRKKNYNVFQKTNEIHCVDIQHMAKHQCLGKNEWPQIENTDAWMLSAETATFMKWGGLGMVASELPENFNKTFANQNHKISIVTPMYTGNTGKKSSVFDGKTYKGSQNICVDVKHIASINVPFFKSEDELSDNKAEVYTAHFNGVDYIFIKNDYFFSINPHPENPSTQDGCYVQNENNVNEVERFAFFSKAVYVLLKDCAQNKIRLLNMPNILIANDWHIGALTGLCKYSTIAESYRKTLEESVAEQIRNIPIVHIAHHLGYQGWDYPNTARLLNSLYEDNTKLIFKNAKAIKNSNERTTNSLIVFDCYNQASASFHLADRVVTVSKNYREEVSTELGLGLDFRDVLKIRKDHRTFFGIVNGYDKNLISPNEKKINHINEYFDGFNFKVFDENSLKNKLNNKKECIRLLSKLATDTEYKQKVLPLTDLHDFEDISSLIKKADKVPFLCATSRLVEQKGYDIAAKAILQTIQDNVDKGYEAPIFVMGGAGDLELYKKLQNLKEEIKKIDKKAAKRIFVFRGYRDEFAYAVQLAADFYMMPSRFEPCGLTQMEAMAKGALPIATSTGGLVDTIKNGVDGFRTEVFFAKGIRVYGSNLVAQKLKNNANAYADTLSKALNCYYNFREELNVMTQNALRKDFGWNVEGGSVYKYYKLFTTGSA